MVTATAGCASEARSFVRIAMARLIVGRPLTDDEVVMHRCDNPSCINPAHLEIGTHADNRADCVRKDRHAKGSAHGRAKLTEEDIPAIRERLDAQDPITQIARDHGVSPRAIRQIRDRDTWTHV